MEISFGRLQKVISGSICCLTFSGLFVGGCATVQNKNLPKNFIISDDPTSGGAISEWKGVVNEHSNCISIDADPQSVALTFDNDHLAIEKEKALCKVSNVVVPRTDVKVLLRSIAEQKTTCPQCLHREYSEEWKVLNLSDSERPSLGIALSGGGPRSGSFSIGVLKALYENGLLADANYLSTVSGGGYAAYWYFSQLKNIDSWKKDQHTPFSDCYHELKTRGTDENIDAQQKNDKSIYCDSTNEESFKFQYYLSKHTDLVANRDGGIVSHIPDYAYKFYPLFGALIYPLSGFSYQIWSLGFMTSVPHHLANTVMDWSWNGSFYGLIYRQGIHNAYGLLGKDANVEVGCQEGFDGLGRRANGKKCLSFQKNENLPGSSLGELTTEYWNAVTGMDAVAASQAKERPYPIWIINTQGLSANSAWNACSPGDIHRTLMENSYEFTPYGYGSGLMGYFSRTTDLPPGRKGIGPRLITPSLLEPLAAVHASGAAVDSAGLSSKKEECLFRMGEQLGNFSLGVKLTNPIFEESQRVTHRLLPWPMYYLDGDKYTPNSPEIYLSDGGHIDNLGLYSLIRRGVKTIIVFDASEDEEGLFDDLLKTSGRLANDVAFADMEICSKSKPCAKSAGVGIELIGLCSNGEKNISPCADANYFEFNICKDSDCSTSDVAKPRFDPRHAKNNVFIGRYFLLDTPEISLGKIIYVKNSLPEGWENVACDIQAKSAFPCATKEYLNSNRKGSPYFPNNSTLRITLDSSASLYRAYRDLGNYLGTMATKFVMTEYR